MSMTEDIPARWVSALRPFLQRADEFASRHPAVSFYLRMHVATLAMKMREPNDSEGTKYLTKLLTKLDQEKSALSAELSGLDGRTELTKFALALFTKADDEERAGHANLNIVRLFFTASILFDATAQFTNDGALDPIAAEKRTYARYIAVRMKKSLDSGVPYESPHALETHARNEDNEEESAPANIPPGDRHATDISKTPFFNGANAAEETRTFGGDEERFSPPPYEHALAQPQRNSGGGPAGDEKGFVTQHGESGKNKYENPPNVSLQASSPAPAASSAGKPSIDAMIEAQKFAKQAVSALQFYDCKNARQQLLAALNLLEKK